MRCFVRYVQAVYGREAVEKSYRAYVTDSLRLIPQMAYVTKRWVDILYPEPEMTAEEIVDKVLGGLEALR